MYMVFIDVKSFQLTASRRGWLTAIGELWIFMEFQLTASRRGWPVLTFVISFLEIISTHSLTKRLTITTDIVDPLVCISTHSLTKRLTGLLCIYQLTSYISTHSLTKRLTDLTHRNFLSVLYFNSQPHEEADFIWSRAAFQFPVFQLTASRRGWLSSHLCGWFLCLFQLTASRRGWPHAVNYNQFCSDISTHSLTKRLTYRLSPIVRFPKHFNSQPHEEADG